MPRFSPVDNRGHFADAELEILAFWRDADVFRRGLAQREGAPPYIFYEGPPTANGTPGLHHVEARAFKDLFPRYRQMNGYSVERKAGWDTHGLPVELEVERTLKISGKKQIEDFGIAEFNRLCKESVNQYIDEWEQFTARMGFWLDFGHAYRTYDSTYIESVWWSLKQLWNRNLLYQGYKVAPYCPRCQTSLSSHELSQGYRDDTADPSVFIKFRLADSDGTTFFIAWTTTPWTLPGNVALAVHPRETYVRVRQGDEDLILAKARLSVLEGDYEVAAEMSGSELVDVTYEPLFPESAAEGKAYIVVPAPGLVSMDEGTGIVHTAAAYGDADLELCKREGVAVRHVVGLDGRFMEPSRYAGLRVKDQNGETDRRIIADLREMGLLYSSGRIKHSYPFCWRCESALIYYALTSWFIRTTAVRDELLKNNADVHWQPAHIRDGRMGNWLENLVDWNLSRSRYWGTPLPIWLCDNADCDGRTCIGSAAEAGLTAGDDLHKPFIDAVTLPCDVCGGTMHRVPGVIDCWYDSGAMPFAQYHYPFENKERFETRHPADYIAEAMDQTRGWFFSLLAESTLLFGGPAYKNVICLGPMVDTRGKKMSKSKGNAVEPTAIFEEFGADATRWYFYSSVTAGNEYRFGPLVVQDVVRRFMLTLWNTYSFYVTYALIDDVDLAEPPGVADRNVLDRWCLARLAETVDGVRAALDVYDATDATRIIELFVDDISKWYVRRSRDRFWKSASASGNGEAGAIAAGLRDVDADKLAAHATLFTVLEALSRLLAPFMPFVSERMYRNLSGFEGDVPPDDGVPDSVHLSDYPVALDSWYDPELIVEMARVRSLVEKGLGARTASGIQVKQPLAAAIVLGEPIAAHLEPIFAEELNVKSVTYAPRTDEHEDVELDTAVTPELRLEGLVRELSRKANALRKQGRFDLEDRITLRVEGTVEIHRAVDAHRDHLMAETLAIAIESTRGEVAAEWEGMLGGETCWVGVSR